MSERVKPETLGQARRFDRVCRLAEQAGLCPRCAAQFAYGAQGGNGGFASVHTPCASCTVVMLDWPVQRPNGYRSPVGDLSRPATWLRRTLTGRTAPGMPDPGEV